MGREVRRVPPNWIHPRDRRNCHQPMYDQSLREARGGWLLDRAEFEANPPKDYDGTADDWHGPDPTESSAYYRPDWTDEERTHFQLYETCSEGTPLSVPFETREKLLDWVLNEGVGTGLVTAFGSMPGSDDYWRKVILEGTAGFGLLIAAGKGEPF